MVPPTCLRTLLEGPSPTAIESRPALQSVQLKPVPFTTAIRSGRVPQDATPRPDPNPTAPGPSAPEAAAVWRPSRMRKEALVLFLSSLIAIVYTAAAPPRCGAG